MSEGGAIEIRSRVNGVDRVDQVPATMTLIEYLHDRCELTGAKLACSRAVCGSCTVLIDGIPGASCSLFAFHADGAEILSIEGLADEGTLHPIQAAFSDNSAFQCGYCTSGMIMLAKALLDREPNPSRDTVTEWISSNICRCTGYRSIVDAVLDAGSRLRSRKPEHE